MTCIFCQIINKEKHSDIIYEDDKIIVIKDINPKASIHLLIIPKKHITSINEVAPEDRGLMGSLVLTAQKIAKEKGLSSYKLLVNVGRPAGQLVDHLHVHLMCQETETRSL